MTLLYIQLTICFLIGRKHTVKFRNLRLGRHLVACQGYSSRLLSIVLEKRAIILPAVLRVFGNHAGIMVVSLNYAPRI